MIIKGYCKKCPLVVMVLQFFLIIVKPIYLLVVPIVKTIVKYLETMEETIKKIISASLGMAIIAKNKTKEIIDELIEKGKMSEEEGNKFIDDLKAETEKSKKDAEDEIRKMINNTLQKMDVPTKEDYDRLEKRVKVLEQGFMEQKK
jgi:polyhydroxyalkanoate synthesis regulator phasin